MPTISAGKDGYIVFEAGKAANTHAAARGASTGTLVNNTATSYSLAVYYLGGTPRSPYVIIRSFFFFDTSGISSTVSSVTLNIRGSTNSTADIIALESTAFGGDGSSDLVANDFGRVDFSTPYSLEVTSWNTNSSYNSISLNSAAKTDMQNNDELIIALVQYDNDYADVDGATQEFKSGIIFSESAGSDVYLDYTLTGYSHNTIGVAGANISSVINVTSANIDKIIGVD